MHAFKVFLICVLFALPSNGFAKFAQEFSGAGNVDLAGVGTRRAVLHIRKAAKLVNDKIEPVYYGVFSIAGPDGDFGSFMTFRFDNIAFDTERNSVYLYSKRFTPQGYGGITFSISASMDDAGNVRGVLYTNQVGPTGRLVEGSFQLNTSA